MVVIDGHAHYPGSYNSAESLERDHSLIGDYHAGRRARGSSGGGLHHQVALSVGELILARVVFADRCHAKDGRPTVESTNNRLVLRLVRKLYVHARRFGDGLVPRDWTREQGRWLGFDPFA